MTESTEQPEQPSQKDQLLAALEQHEGAPTPAIIDGWKETFGDVFIAAFDADEVFVFRALNRKEYRELQIKAADTDPMEYEESVVKTCLLFQSVSQLDNKAGTIPSLLEMVMQNSNFVPPAIAAQLVTKL